MYKMEDIGIQDGVLKHVVPNKEVIEIPEGVHTIESAFGVWDKSKVKKLVLPSTLKAIARNAFSGSKNLEEVILPEGLTTIGAKAFSECTSLKKITLPSTLTVLEDFAFSGNKSLKEITIPENLALWGIRVFDGCESLESVTIKTTMTEIPNGSFMNCTSLKNVVFPKNLTRIGISAFRNAPLGELSLPDGVEVIDANAFSNTGLKLLNLPKSLNAIGYAAFSKNPELKTIKIPANTSVLGAAAFTGCHPCAQFIIDANNKSFYVKDEFILDGDGEIVFGNCVGDVKLPEGITKVKEATFIGNETMESVEIPEGVEVIEGDAFFKCARLKKVILPSTVKSFMMSSLQNEDFPWGNQDHNAFAQSPIEDFIVSENNPIYYSENGCVIQREDNKIVLGCWGRKVLEIPPSARSVDCYVFRNDPWIEEIVFGKEFGMIGNFGFSGCPALKKVKLAEDMPQIGSCAFYHCVSLKEVVMPSNLRIIGAQAFETTALEKVELPETVETICQLAFYGCSKLSSINIPDGVRYIDWKAFEYVPAEIKIPYNCHLGSKQGCHNSVIMAAHISPKHFDDTTRAAMTRGFVKDERRKDVPKEIHKDYKTEIRNSFKRSSYRFLEEYDLDMYRFIVEEKMLKLEALDEWIIKSRAAGKEDVAVLLEEYKQQLIEKNNSKSKKS